MTIAPERIEDNRTIPELYDDLIKSLVAIVGDERDRTANLANTAAVLWQSIPDINWVGFYLFDPPELVVGPFQGKPACVRIKLGHGVCGTAGAMRRTIIVPDVRIFGGHIACDPDSRSEIVVPMFLHGNLLGVLDVDSASINRFTDEDRDGLERVAALMTNACDWSQHDREQLQRHGSAMSPRDESAMSQQDDQTPS